MNQTITPSSVFLVSGGAKGVTAQCVIRMAEAYRCKFILLGRSRLESQEPTWAEGLTDGAQLKKNIMAHIQAQGQQPTPREVQRLFNGLQSQREIQETLAAVTQAGAQAHYVSVDVTSQQALNSELPAITQTFGPITGILHGAGALADKLIEKKSAEDFERVYSTKVNGLEALLGVVPPSQLTHLILFSSVAGFYGNIGQSDYAMANETLDKTAHLLRKQYPNCRVISINWGPWDGGMVTPEIKRAFSERNIEIIPVPVGTQILVDELAPGKRDPQVLVGNGLLSSSDDFDLTLRNYQIRRQLQEAANPFLVDHKIGGQAVLPAMCAINWVTTNCEQIYPKYHCAGFEQFRVLKGIVFDDTLADEYILDLQEIEKSHEQIRLEGKIWSQAGQLMRYHYSIQITLRREPLPCPTEAINLQSVDPIAGRLLYQTGALFHGPLFQGIEQILSLTDSQLTMACRLPMLSDKQQGQFPIQGFNPYLSDVMLQSMVAWVGQKKQAGSLPLSCDAGQQFRALPFGETFYVSMMIRQQTDLNLVADISSHDAQGQIYSQLQGAKVTISKRLNRLTGMT